MEEKYYYCSKYIRFPIRMLFKKFMTYLAQLIKRLLVF